MIGKLRLTIVVDRAGAASRSFNGVDGPAVVRLLENLKGARDTTVSMTQDGVEEKLLLAFDGDMAFLALERPDGLFQFSRMDAVTGRHPFTVGGQQSDIEDRYLLDAESAAAVVNAWINSDEESSLGSWERQ